MLGQLELLGLDDTQVTDAGLELAVKGLTRPNPNLQQDHVTIAGLEHLQGLTQLRELHLDLGHTPATDAAVKRLQKALPNCQITY